MMGIFDKLTGRHKDAEQEEDPNLQQQGGQQGYETSQDMGTAQSNIGQQPQGGYDDPDMNMGDQDPDMSMGDQNPDMSMGDQNPNMNMGDQDPDEDPDMGDEQPKRGNQGW